MINWTKLFSRIPHQIQLKKARYIISWVDKFEGEKHVGITHFDPKQIMIARNLSDKDTVLTYIHEVLHAVSEEYDVGLTENQVLKLEKAAYYLLKPGNVFKKDE